MASSQQLEEELKDLGRELEISEREKCAAERDKRLLADEKLQLKTAVAAQPPAAATSSAAAGGPYTTGSAYTAGGAAPSGP